MLLASTLLVVVRPGVAVTRTVDPDRVSSQESAVARLEISARPRWPSPAAVLVDRIGDRTVDVAVPALAPGARRTLRYTLPTPRRGVVTVGPLTLERRDPLGLVRRRSALGQPTVLWVHPRQHPVPALPAGTLLEAEGAPAPSAPRGSVAFSSLREYVPGDDPRLVHWRSTARTGTLMVRENVDTSRPTSTVVVDTRRGAWPDDPAAGLDEACEVAASVIAAMRGQARPVTLAAVGEDLAAAQAAGARDLLDRLALLQPTAADPARDGLAELVERAPAGGALIVLTGTANPGLVARLSAQRRRFTPVVLLQLEPGAPGLTDRAAGLLVVRGSDAATVAAGWRSMLGGGHR